jgi:A/G-specific adenine glycosylase
MTSSDTIHNDKWSPALLEWFASHGRDLPWRQDRDPYKVWVSEIMLQQTKVEAVKPYYDSWMDRFPTIQSLAQASQDDVLRQWQGLGYYSRAKNLHAAVCEVQTAYGGKVPSDRAAMLSLKGVGDYTAGAILSLAYGKPEAAVDGNVLRVFARIYNITDNILTSAVKKTVTALVLQQMPMDQPGRFNEALMDFGAMVCIPKHPRCHECPLTSWCQAKLHGVENDLPVRIVKKHTPTDEITVAVVEHRHAWLIHRRPEKGLLSSMWEFPNALGKGEEGRLRVQNLLAEEGLTVRLEEEPIGEIKHVFSHRKWHMVVYNCIVLKNSFQAKEDWQWLDRTRYTEVPWAGPHGKITAWL